MRLYPRVTPRGLWPSWRCSVGASGAGWRSCGLGVWQRLRSALRIRRV